MIDFLLNGQPRRCEASPDTSVLELLRDTLGQTGTKEGCASGDCGACTVAIGEGDAAGKTRYHAANACITPAHQLQGRALVTVEGLARGETLHPAQAAMVEHHGSQCGFCTPGIVMSLFTLHESQRQEDGERPAPLTPERLEAALGGNLCRCTGYRPIRDAALAMGDSPRGASRVARPSPDAAAPATEATPEAAFIQPTTLEALIAERRAHPEAPIVAGGTDLWLEVTQRLARFPRVVDITRVDELAALEETTLEDGRAGWWIWRRGDVRAPGAAVRRALPGVRPPAASSGLGPGAQPRHPGRQHRQRLPHRRHPAGAARPGRAAMAGGPRDGDGMAERELPLDDFFLDYKKTALREGEVIRAIFLPRTEPERHLKVWKLSKRREDDISAVLGAFAWRIEEGVLRDVRLAFGGMAAIPATRRGRRGDAGGAVPQRGGLCGGPCRRWRRTSSP